MTAYDQALAMYQERGYPESDMIADARWHMRYGYLYVTPLDFVMARPVSSQWKTEIICDLRESRHSLNNELTLPLDMWHIHIAVGDMRELLSHIPYPLPFISFERRGKFRQYSYTRFDEIKETTTTTNSDSSSARKR